MCLAQALSKLVRFEENQSKLPVLLALVLVCGGLVLRQDAIAIFGVYQTLETTWQVQLYLFLAYWQS